MRGLGALVRHEWRLQARSLRFRLALLAFLAASVTPALILHAHARRVGMPAFGAAHLDLASRGAPFLAVIWVVLVVGATAWVPGERQILLSAPMRSAGWVLRKLLAQLSVVVPGSLLAYAAPLVAAVALGDGTVPWSNAAWWWLVEIAPLVVISSAGYLGLLRIVRSEALALIVGASAVPAVSLLTNHGLALFGLRLDGTGWSGLDRFSILVRVLRALALGDGGWTWWSASDSAWDAAEAFERAGPRLAVPAAIALSFLGAAVGHVGRSRPEHAPLTVAGDHPLRSFVRAYGRLRRRLRSDAGLDRVDRAVRAGGVALALALLGWLAARALAWEAVARERYRVEVADVGETTSRDLVPESFHVSGSLTRGGRVDLVVEQMVRNTGAEERSHLAFHLDRHLELDALEVTEHATGASHEVTTERGFDRVELDLHPAIVPGAAVTLRYALAGRPSSEWLQLRRLGQESFAASYERLRDAAVARDLSPLAGSWRTRAATPGQVRLRASHLLLAPRWDPWTLSPDLGPGMGGRSVLADEHTPSFTLALDLELPSDWLLVDGCGAISEIEGGRVRHRSSCAVTLPTIALLGGRRERVASPGGGAVLAAIPGHGPLAEEVLASMARTVELSARAWPGLAGLRRVAAVEMPPERSAGPLPREPSPIVMGRLIAVPETALRTGEPLAAPELVASLLIQEIEVARPVEPGEQRAVSALLRAILLRRMGLGAESGWMWPQPHLHWRLSFPLLRAPAYDAMAWQVKMPALLHGIEAQVGTEALMRGTRDFVSRGGDDSVGVRDLLAAIAFAADGEAAAWLDRVYDDSFVHGRNPRLEVGGVTSRREGRSWRVSAELRNTGSGQARCPVVARGEAEELERWVAVDVEATVEVSLVLASRPHTLVLDPARECFLLRDRRRPRNQHDLSGSGS